VVNLGNIYYNSMADPQIKKLLRDPMKKTNKGRDIGMGDRDCFGKMARIIYKTMRAIYVSAMFYWIPFLMVIAPYFAGLPFAKSDCTREEVEKDATIHWNEC